MPVVQLPDGTLVQLPDMQPAPQLSLMDKASLAGDVALEKIGRPLARGGIQMLQGIDTALRASPAAQINPLLWVYKTAVPPTPSADSVLPVPEGETKLETYSRRMLEGLPTAALGGGQAAAMAIPSMIGPAVGQAAGDFTKGIAPKLAPWADMIANALTQGGMGMASGMRKGWPSSNEDKAAKDTGTLTNMALERIQAVPPGGFNPAEVANKVAGAANKVIGSLEDVASTSFGDRVAGVNVKAKDVAELYSGLKSIAKSLPSREAAAAYDDVANSLIRKDGGGFITDLQTLSGQLKRFKSALPSPDASSGVKWAKGDINNAVRDAEMMLGDIAPQFKRANEAFAGWHKDVVDPALESAIGKISDKNPNIVAPTPVDRLGAMVKGRSPGDVEQTIQQLTAGGASPADIARAVVQLKVEGGGLVPGQRVFGGPGSSQEAAMSSLLNSAVQGKGPSQLSSNLGTPRVGVTGAENVRAPLDTADAIAKALAKGNNSLSESLSIHSGGLSLRGIARPGIFEKIGGMFGGNPGSQSVTKLIESASPEEIAKLQQLAAYDPQLRMALSLMGIGRATLPSMPDVMKAGQ